MKLGVIYKITNTKTDHIYVGQTTQPIELRLTQHIRAAKNLNKGNMVISRAIRKYGPDVFSISSIVIGIPDYFLNAFEKYWIHYYNSFKHGYNASEGGGGTLGCKSWNSGKSNIYSNATKEKMRQAKLGKTPSNLEQLRLLAKTREGIHHPNMKLADIYDYLTNKLIAENVTLTKWARENNNNQGNLCATARGIVKHAKGVYAKFIKEG